MFAAGASQNASGSIGRIANSYNSARDTRSDSRNTTNTTTNNTTTDNSRAYNDSNHNELLHTKVNGPVGIGSPACAVLRRGNIFADTQRFCLGNNTNIYYTALPSPAVNTQTREDLEKFGRLEEAVT